MGQAKQRGTFEERKAAAIKRDNAERERREAAKREREKRIANEAPRANQNRSRRPINHHALILAALGSSAMLAGYDNEQS